VVFIAGNALGIHFYIISINNKLRDIGDSLKRIADALEKKE
jgi:hypothetical protein